MNILHICPANLATGGTEGIHHLVSELCKCGANAKILYEGIDLTDPQPKEFDKYQCEYVTEIPKDFSGVLIFPEVWGNRVALPEYQKYQTAINWQGIDVYSWHTPAWERGKFLSNPETLHITMSEYGMEYLRKFGLEPIKIPDCIGDEFYEQYDHPTKRSDLVLYNPVSVKLTTFQEIVMARCTTELGIRFKPIEGYTRKELIDLFYSSKLYIDFGVFSGRERLPREAVMCGCCILTSNQGTAKYYLDNSIPSKYKLNDIDQAIKMIRYVVNNYDQCKPDYDEYRELLTKDREDYPKAVKELYNAILNNNTRT